MKRRRRAVIRRRSDRDELRNNTLAPTPQQQPRAQQQTAHPTPAPTGPKPTAQQVIGLQRQFGNQYTRRLTSKPGPKPHLAAQASTVSLQRVNANQVQRISFGKRSKMLFGATNRNHDDEDKLSNRRGTGAAPTTPTSTQIQGGIQGPSTMNKVASGASNTLSTTSGVAGGSAIPFDFVGGLGDARVHGNKIGTDADDLKDKDHTRIVDSKSARGTLGVVGGLGSSVLGSVEVLENLGMAAGAIRQLYGGGLSGREKIAQSLLIAHGSLNAPLTLGSTISSVGGTIATAVGNSDTAKEFGAATGVLGALKDGLSMVINSTDIVVTVALDIRAIFKKSMSVAQALKEHGAGLVLKSLQVLQDFLNFSGKVLGATSKLLALANTAENFTQAFPIIGDSISIFVSLLNIIKNTIEIIRKVYRMLKHAYNDYMLGAMETANAVGQKVSASTRAALSTISSKRIKRQIVPLISDVLGMVGDVSKISGAVMNIIGVATSPAYGAGAAVMGVGYGLKGAGTAAQLGGTALKGAAFATRNLKQFGRNQAAKGGRFGRLNDRMRQSSYKAIRGLGFNTDKSTTEKNKQYADMAADILGVLGSLPPGFDKTDAGHVQQYNYALQLMYSSGIDLDKFFENNSDPTKQGVLLLEALKQRA